MTTMNFIKMSNIDSKTDMKKLWTSTHCYISVGFVKFGFFV